MKCLSKKISGSTTVKPGLEKRFGPNFLEFLEVYRNNLSLIFSFMGKPNSQKTHGHIRKTTEIYRFLLHHE